MGEFYEELHVIESRLVKLQNTLHGGCYYEAYVARMFAEEFRIKKGGQ